MQIIINDTDSPATLLATARFLQELSGAVTVPEVEPEKVVHVPATDIPQPPVERVEVQLPIPGVPPPPAAAAPPAPPAPESPFDVDNLPWDARIHAAGKTKNADGTWRKRRNLDSALLATVTAELTAQRANAMAQTLGIAEEPEEAPAIDPAAAFAATAAAAPPPPPAAAPPPPPAQPVAPPPPTTDAAPAPTTFLQLMPRLTKALGDKRLTNGDMNACLNRHGVSALGALNSAMTADPTLMSRLWPDLNQTAGGTL